MASILETSDHSWFEWSCHTCFSFLSGAGHPSEHVQRAFDLGYGGLGICDFDGVYGLAKSYITYKKIKRDNEYINLKIFYGSEIHLAGEHDLPIFLRSTAIFYALNHRGYEVLCGLLTCAHQKGKYTGYLTLEDIAGHGSQLSSDVVCLLPMRGSLRRGDDKAYENVICHLKRIFKDRCYQIISPAMHPAEDVWISKYLFYARKHDLKILLSQDVFFPKSEDKIMSDLQQAIRNNRSLDEITEFIFANDERCLKSKPEIFARFERYDFFEEAMENSLALQRMFSFCFSDLSYKYPAELIPEGHTSQSWLEEISWQSASTFYHGSIPHKVKDIIGKELGLVQTLGFADYFLTVADIVSWARSKNILCQGRGSAANSAICFVLGITSVDPMLFDVLFERFISVERGDPPDIDVDFEHERREEVIAYIYSRYGRDRAAMVANIITFKTKGAVRSVGGALGIRSDVLDQSAKFLGRYSNKWNDLEDVLRAFISEYSHKNPDCEATILLNDPLIIGKWALLSKKLKGYPRHLGIHSGGFLISHLPIGRISPIEPATMRGRTVVQWDKEDIEALGFFKIDVLALGMLTAIRKTFDTLRDSYNKDFDLASVPREDPKTYEMISRADTVGVFQIESRAQMSMLPRLRPKCFYDLVIEIAIIRPGPIQGGLIHPFLRRRDGLEPVVYPHRKLEPILRRTLGVPIFQEQVMRIAMAVGGFSAGEADELRRKIGSWQIKGSLSSLLDKLERGMKSEGIAEHFVGQILKQLEAFSAYGFPESHAASFALLTYVSCYLKCHHPDAFFVSLLNSMPMGFYSTHSIIQQVKKEGIEIRRICILKSQCDHTLEKSPESRRPFAMRLGFRIIRGLSKTGAERLAERRKNRVWKSMDEFMTERIVDRADLVALAAADVFRVFGVDRRQAIWKSQAIPLSFCIEEREETLQFEAESPKQRLDADFKSYETSVYSHPVSVMMLHYWEYSLNQNVISDSRKIRSTSHRTSVKVFGLVISRQAPPTAHGMVFITLEDAHGFLNLAINPQVYKAYAHLLDTEIFLLAEGFLQRNNEAHSITVSGLYERVGMGAAVYELDTSEYAGNGPAPKKKLKNKRSSDIPRFSIRDFH